MLSNPHSFRAMQSVEGETLPLTEAFKQHKLSSPFEIALVLHGNHDKRELKCVCITGAGLDKVEGFKETTSNSDCTQYSSADCEKY